MKIILIKDVKKLGKKDDIIDVSDGYATNFLIKNGLAIQYTKTSVSRLEQEIDERELQEELLIQEMKKIKEKIEKENITFEVTVGKTEKVFGKISSKQIKDKLMEIGYDIQKTSIEINNPIDTLGFHNVTLNLHKKVIAKIKINLVKK